MRVLSVQNSERQASTPLTKSVGTISSVSSFGGNTDSAPRSASVPPEEVIKALKGEAMDDRSSVSTDTSELYSAGQGRLNVLSEAPPIATVIPLDAFKRLHHNNHRGGSPFRMCSRRSVPAVATDANMSQISDFCDSDYMYHSSQESSQMLTTDRRITRQCYEQRRFSDLMRIRSLYNCYPASLPRQPLSRNVTLTMEVQVADFPSLLDRREAWAQRDTISEIMHDTNCMVQFADQLCLDEESIERFNQVTIIGLLPQVEQARRRIRALAPITLGIPLLNLKPGLAKESILQQLSRWLDEKLLDFPTIQFSVSLGRNGFQSPFWSNGIHHDSFLIRGSSRDVEAIAAASDRVLELLFPPQSTSKSWKEANSFFTTLEIPASQRRWMVGSPDGSLMKSISSYTKASIHFPTASDAMAPTSYLISGTAKSVLVATKCFQAISPVRLQFDVEQTDLYHPPAEANREYDRFDTEYSVITSVRKSAYEGAFRLDSEHMRHSIALTTSEENILNLYYARREMLTYESLGDEPVIADLPPPEEALFLSHLTSLIAETSCKIPKSQATSESFERADSNAELYSRVSSNTHTHSSQRRHHRLSSASSLPRSSSRY